MIAGHTKTSLRVQTLNNGFWFSLRGVHSEYQMCSPRKGKLSGLIRNKEKDLINSYFRLNKESPLLLPHRLQDG